MSPGVIMHVVDHHAPFPSLLLRPRATTRLTIMADVSSRLIVQSRLALHLSQAQFGDLFGKTKRTIQRWEDKGAYLLPSDAEALVRALKPVSPDLAAGVLTATNRETDETGDAGGGHTISKPVASVLRAAATAMRITPRAARAGVAAAFARAAELGLDVHTVMAELAKRR